jgi:hypothetical protein
MSSIPERRRRDPLAAWGELARAQAGVISRAQALNLGLSPKQVYWLVASGRWARVLPGIFVTHTGPRRELVRVWAAVLYCGDQAAAGGRTALWLHGVLDRPPDAVTVCVPTGRRVAAQPGLVVERRRRMAEWTHPTAAPQRLRLEEALLDAVAQAARPADVVSLVVRATQRRLTTAARLRECLARRRGHRWRALLGAVLAEVEDGVQSPLEGQYLRRVERAHTLPRGRRNLGEAEAGRRRYRDVGYDPWLLVVELDGREAHPDDQRFRDMRRDNAVVLSGRVSLRFGWHDVVSDPCGVASQVGAALRAQGWGGRPTPCSPSCPLPAPE